MTLWWLLGVLTVALCEAGAVLDEIGPAKINESTDEPPGNNRTISKRQAGQIDVKEDGKGIENINSLSYSSLPDKRTKFSSWAGKRDPDDSQENKRAKFSSWAGKRDQDDDEWMEMSKRTKFSSWAGKRDSLFDLSDKRRLLAQELAGYSDDPMDEDDDADERLEAEKRGKFSSWGGKRGDASFENKRKFSSWSGKRNWDGILEHYYNPYWLVVPNFNGEDNGIDRILVEKSIIQNKGESGQVENGHQAAIVPYYDPEAPHILADSDWYTTEDKRNRFSNWGGKRKFSSWGGKRSDIDLDFPLETSDLVKRANRFSIWAGKRDSIPYWKSKYPGKRGKFSSWAGKRSDTSMNELTEDKRNKFSSWGGKRSLPDISDIYDNKRTKFSSWAGKRSDSLMADDLEEDKRNKFSSWGGKRSSPDMTDIYSDKRTKFSSWAGKRSDIIMTDNIEEDKRNKFSSWGGKRALPDIFEDKRTKFSSWAGKRFDDSNYDPIGLYKRDQIWSKMNKKVKGKGFSSWGGKRNYEMDEEKEALDEDEESDFDNLVQNKRANKFSSWAGKRSQDIDDAKRAFSSWGGKRNYYELIKDPKITKFSSWAGKRSVDPEEGPDVDKRKENRKSGLLRRYNRFNSWRGKKDNTIPLNDTRTKLDDVNFSQSGDSTNVVKSKRGLTNYFRQFEMIKRNPLLRAWIGKHYSDMMTWKRRPAFSSWGGKRSATPEVVEGTEQFDDLIDEEKRTRFSNWGGKRGHTAIKRSIPTITEPSAVKKNIKMTGSHGIRTAIESRRFYLRSSKDGSITHSIHPIRRQFYAWGGKRDSKS